MNPLLLGFMNLEYLLMVLLPGMLLSGGASWLVRTRFAKYSKIPSTRGYTGQMAAQRLLDFAGITDVKVVRVDGVLTDHYNPSTKQLALSSAVFDRTSVAAIGVATHEAGHAIQHATGYYPLKWRSAIVPVANIGTKFGTYGMMIGLAILAAGSAFGTTVFMVGALAFLMFVLFQLVTLPVEFNASNRAKRLVVEAGIVGEQEREGIDKVLGAAAMTYVAAFVSSLLTLIYFLMKSGLLNGSRQRGF
ncbi:zinc metallopeptidase [Mariniblastus fucicola]|uniref:Neutral zinc metallopeptidase n=1 Tax=Mariniblastus fucicola TaxID=980251 RepID=A0A5B9PKM6_9BACT|nr:zinc metallopeptidase [Mariniblastus fucicola]QEG25272.1 Putative neutral zinc metallopeptidase [Mariniblastus fucicola]